METKPTKHQEKNESPTSSISPFKISISCTLKQINSQQKIEGVKEQGNRIKKLFELQRKNISGSSSYQLGHGCSKKNKTFALVLVKTKTQVTIKNSVTESIRFQSFKFN